MAPSSRPAGQTAWLRRAVIVGLALVALLAVVEIAARQKWLAEKLVSPIVDIRTPATLVAKVRHMTRSPSPRIVLIGDSLVAGRVLRQHGDAAWRANTISADIESRLVAQGHAGAQVMNLGMDGLLPADMETLVDAILPTKPDFIVIDISLRSFSNDFSTAAAQHSREWLKPGLMFRPDGKVRMLPDQLGPSKALERLALNHWTTYRLRDIARARVMEGEPRDRLEGLRDKLVSPRNDVDPATAEMRLLLQVRSRYESASFDMANPQFAAWTRMIAKLRAAGQRTIVFYASENPRLLPSLIDNVRYVQLRAGLAQSIPPDARGMIRYLAANPGLKDEVFIDHVHVNAEGNRIYGEMLFNAIQRPLVGDSALKATLKLGHRPFVEKVGSERVELGRITDFSTSASTILTPETPRFDLKGMPVLSIERRSADAHRDITFLYHWWDSKGVPIGVRDSYHMLRASVVGFEDYPDEIKQKLGNPSAPPQYVDIFEGISARRKAASVAFYIQDSSMRSALNISNGSLILYGHSIGRSELRPDAFSLRNLALPGASGYISPDKQDDLEFGPLVGNSISGRGVSFEIDDVDLVYTVKANHELQAHVSGGEYEIGSMLPQVIAYRTADGDTRKISFHGSDLIRFHYSPELKRLAVDVFEYEFRERSTRGSSAYPNSDGKRIHPNLGIVNELPAGRLQITHSRSSVISFPLHKPGGALAALAFTEHADFVGIAQDTLTMYGDTVPNVVPGKGFLGNGIPLTKTIFPSGLPTPFRSRTASSAVFGELIQSTIETAPEFVKMLRRFRAGGHDVEIGIHCSRTGLLKEGGDIGNDSPFRKTPFVAEALKLTKEFNPVTWVDHGGRDCLWESGWDRNSPHYIIDLLQEHGFKYVNMLGDKYDGRNNMIADDEPSNLLFYSVGLDNKLGDDWKPIVFNTVPIGFSANDFTKEHLKQIIRARGLVNVHTYLPYEATMFELNASGLPVLKANPWYNQMLANIAESGRSGDVFLATTRTLNDYLWAVRQLQVFMSGGQIFVGRAGGEPIRGLTIASRSLEPLEVAVPVISGTRASTFRMQDGVTYQVFDLTR